jgi:hypothetical protein
MANVDLVQLTEQTKKLTAMVVEDEGVANELLSSTFKNFFQKSLLLLTGKKPLRCLSALSRTLFLLTS